MSHLARRSLTRLSRSRAGRATAGLAGLAVGGVVVLVVVLLVAVRVVVVVAGVSDKAGAQARGEALPRHDSLLSSLAGRYCSAWRDERFGRD